MKTKILTKILILFLVFEIPLAIISYISINKINHKLEQEVISSMAEDSRRFAETLNSGIKQIYLSNALLIDQANIKRFAIYPEGFSSYEKAATINAIVEQLSNIALTNPYISCANIYFRSPMRVYHSNNQTIGSFHDMQEDTWDMLSQMADHPETVHLYNHPYLQEDSFSVFIAPYFSSSRYFIIELVLSQEYIASLIQLQAESHDSQHYVQLCQVPFSSDLDALAVEKIQQLSPPAFLDTAISVSIDGNPYYLFWFDLDYCNGSYIELIPTEEILSPLKISKQFSTYFVLVLIVSSILFFAGAYKLIHKPLTNLIDAFKILEKGNFGYYVTDDSAAEFSYLYRAFNKMSGRLSSLIQQHYESKLLMQKAEMKQLQAQINPHFLYNSFFLAQTMLKAGLIEESQQMMELLGTYFHYITKNSMDYVPLEEEYSHMKVYAAIQVLRFQERIQIRMDSIPENCKQLPVPKMILQPILENAFQHGMRNKLRDGIIAVRFDQDQNHLRICIEDNNDTLPEETLSALQQTLASVASGDFQHEMSGLLNIHRRLLIFSQSRGQIKASRSDLGGLRVDIILDVHPAI